MMDLPPFSFLYFCRPAGLWDSGNTAQFGKQIQREIFRQAKI